MIGFSAASGPPGMRVYAVGDVHGRHDLLTAMHGGIMAEIMRDRPADWRIVYLGDYVDRGPDSRGVLEFLAETTRREPRVVALAGNHDVGLLDFLAQPDPYGMFAMNGGFETALSYGVEIDFISRETTEAGHAELKEAMPESHLAFLSGLPFSAEFGDFFFCHAGIRPGVPLDRQSVDDLIWIRAAFHHHRDLHPKVIVHGHTPVEAPQVMENRVNLDTGACFTGRLTALAIEGGQKRLLEATE